MVDKLFDFQGFRSDVKFNATRTTAFAWYSQTQARKADNSYKKNQTEYILFEVLLSGTKYNITNSSEKFVEFLLISYKNMYFQDTNFEVKDGLSSSAIFSTQYLEEGAKWFVWM